MVKRSGRKPYRIEIFKKYIAWKSLPTEYLSMRKNVLEKLGVADQEFDEIYKIRSQKEFAEKFDIKDRATLTDWNKRPELQKICRWVESVWQRRKDVMEANMIASVYMKALKTGRVKHARFLAQEAEGWTGPNIRESEEIKKMAKTLQAIATKDKKKKPNQQI